MKSYLVGGAVRDKILGLPIKERDWVVVGGTVDDMLRLGYRQVGKDFPVFLHPLTSEEYALARLERKTKPGYSGFSVDSSPHVTLIEDLERRDLTINAIAYDIEMDAYIDPFHGREDIQNKRLRHVSQAFVEDPVRILRIARFLARFAHLGFEIEQDTLILMRQMVKNGEVDALVAERVWKELERALKEANPEKFFLALTDCQALPILFPEVDVHGAGLKALISAVPLSDNPLIRFAALFHQVKSPKQTITALCQRYRSPHHYRELAILTANFFPIMVEEEILSAAEWAHLFSRTDAYRREVRFNQFLTACKAIAQAHQRTFKAANPARLLQAAKSVDVKSLLQLGLSHEAFVLRLQKERVDHIAQAMLKN